MAHLVPDQIRSTKDCSDSVTAARNPTSRTSNDDEGASNSAKCDRGKQSGGEAFRSPDQVARMAAFWASREARKRAADFQEVAPTNVLS